MDHMPRLPLSEEANAKVRLERLLEREKRVREADRLESVGLAASHYMKNKEVCALEGCDEEDLDGDRDGDLPRSPDDWVVAWGIGEELRQEVIHWILEVVFRFLSLFGLVLIGL